VEKLLFRGCRGYREYREYRVCREGGGPDGPPGFYGASAQARRMPMRDNLRDNRPTLETKSLCFGVVGGIGSVGKVAVLMDRRVFMGILHRQGECR